MKRAHFYRFTDVNGNRHITVRHSLTEARKSIPDSFGDLACMFRKPVILSSKPMHEES